MEPLNSTPYSYTSAPTYRDMVQKEHYNIQNSANLSRVRGVEINIKPLHHPTVSPIHYYELLPAYTQIQYTTLLNLPVKSNILYCTTILKPTQLIGILHSTNQSLLFWSGDKRKLIGLFHHRSKQIFSGGINGYGIFGIRFQ